MTDRSQGRARRRRTSGQALAPQTAEETSAVVSFAGPTVVLDAQAMSLLAEPAHHHGHRRLVALLKAYEQAGYVAGISVVTVAEQCRTGEAGQRLAWWRSQLIRVPVSEQIAADAAALLEAAALDGHDNVIDAIVVATAATSPDQARVLSCDSSHLPALCKAATDLRRGRPGEVQTGVTHPPRAHRRHQE